MGEDRNNVSGGIGGDKEPDLERSPTPGEAGSDDESSWSSSEEASPSPTPEDLDAASRPRSPSADSTGSERTPTHEPPPATTFNAVNATNKAEFFDWIADVAAKPEHIDAMASTIFTNLKCLGSYDEKVHGKLSETEKYKLVALESSILQNTANQAAFRQAWTDANIERFQLDEARQRYAADVARRRDSSASTSTAGEGGASVDNAESGEYDVDKYKQWVNSVDKNSEIFGNPGKALVFLLMDEDIAPLRHAVVRIPAYLLGNFLKGVFWDNMLIRPAAAIARAAGFTSRADSLEGYLNSDKVDKSLPALWQGLKLAVKAGVLIGTSPITVPLLAANKDLRDKYLPLVTANVTKNAGDFKKLWEDCSLYNGLKWAASGLGMSRYLPPITIMGVTLNRYGSYIDGVEDRLIKDSTNKKGLIGNQAAFLINAMRKNPGLGNNIVTAQEKLINAFALNRTEQRLAELEQSLGGGPKPTRSDTDEKAHLNNLAKVDQNQYQRYLKDREVFLKGVKIGKNDINDMPDHLRDFDPDAKYKGGRFAVFQMAAGYRTTQALDAIERNEPKRAVSPYGVVGATRAAVNSVASAVSTASAGMQQAANSQAAKNLAGGALTAYNTASLTAAGAAMVVGAAAATIGAAVPVAISAVAVAKARDLANWFVGNESNHTQKTIESLSRRMEGAKSVGKGMLHAYKENTAFKYMGQSATVAPKTPDPATLLRPDSSSTAGSGGTTPPAPPGSDPVRVRLHSGPRPGPSGGHGG